MKDVAVALQAGLEALPKDVVKLGDDLQFLEEAKVGDKVIVSGKDAVVLQQQIGVVFGEFAEVKPCLSVDYHASQEVLSVRLLAEEEHLCLLLTILYLKVEQLFDIGSDDKDENVRLLIDGS